MLYHHQQIQCPPLNWIVDNNIVNRCAGPTIYKQYKKCRLIESFGYCYHFYVCPKRSYKAADTVLWNNSNFYPTYHTTKCSAQINFTKLNFLVMLKCPFTLSCGQLWLCTNLWHVNILFFYNHFLVNFNITALSHNRSIVFFLTGYERGYKSLFGSKKSEIEVTWSLPK